MWLATSWPVAGRVLINEIHYDAEPKTEPAEFVELYNSGTQTVNISGWRIAGGISFIVPNGTGIGPGQYLLIAQNPGTVLSKWSASALGPWAGRLNNDGDRITLRNAAGGVEDEVEYQLGFPWPTVGDPPGYSIELINPAFDNTLGGNWRAAVIGNPVQQSQTLISDHSSGWRCFKGRSEASSPTTAWRQGNFNDSSWSTGSSPVGYDASIPMGVNLTDMRSNYTSFFLRRSFVVEDTTPFVSLRLEALYDDGFKLWLNGTNVLNQLLPTNEVPYTATSSGTRESSNYDVFDLDKALAYLLPGTNILAVQVHNTSLSGSSDAFFDCRLIALSGPPAHGPTPGRVNCVFAANAPPQIRQVDHSPNEPRTGQTVTITAKITDPEGVGNVSLNYQLVDPGNYISLTSQAYTNNWTAVAMNDSGLDGDEHAGDSVYTTVLPGTLQQHRRLVRYRINAVDGLGLGLTVPYADDPQPNFAFFCYDGVPAWRAAVQPGVTPVINFDTNVMRHLPTVHLISSRSEVENATWFSRYRGDLYQWTGTLVYNGKVYDHIHYRARGGVWRYSMVKNMWKFDLNRGHYLEMRDDYGRKYQTEWTKLNLGACIQQGNYWHRGEQGMFEAVGFRLFNLAGVPAPKTTFLQFRIIDDVLESDPSTQYEGDLWGLYQAVEQEDGRFLEEHDLPDGNFYKMDSNVTPFPYGELNNQGATGVTDKSDLSAFVSGLNGNSPVDWWRANWYLPNGCSYQAIVQAIHHYDIGGGKNYFYYLNPDTRLWTVVPWDLDLTWADNMYDAGGQGAEPFKAYALPKPEINLEYRNRVREIRDLLFNTDQAWKLIEEHAWLLRGDPSGSPTFLDADRCQWDYNPKMVNSAYSDHVEKAQYGYFYQWQTEPGVSKDFNGCVQLMKNYVVSRSLLLDSHAADSAIPSRPVVTYIGTSSNYALNRLTFRASPYQGTYPFGAMKWRVGEVTDPLAPAFDPAEPRAYEITSVWESAELNTFQNEITIPAGVLKVGHAYRVRVRMKDTTGRWSSWSAPAQFVAGLPDTSSALLAHLRLSELMYNPPAGSEYEFIELHNTSQTLTLDLAGAKFTSGVDFTFPAGTALPPGGYLQVAGTTNLAAFRAQYNLPGSVPVIGAFTGNLANGGEELTLKVSLGGPEVVSFEYLKGRGWPLATKGAGHSLVPLDSALGDQASGALDYPGNWRPSSQIGGSPGQPDPAAPAPLVLVNEITAHTDFSDPSWPQYDSNDWVELYNATGTNINLAGWFLSDDPAAPRKWTIPAVTIPARSRLTFDEVTGFHSPITSGFGLDKAGEQLLLSYLPGMSLDRVVDAVAFAGQENDRSMGRYPDGGAWCFSMLRSSNTVNSAGIINVVISEIMYRPPDLDTNDNTRDEYLELYNASAGSIALQDTSGPWRLGGGVSFTFPLNTTIPAQGTLLVVNFDPAVPGALATFRTVYGITNVAIPIVGPYSGKLGNRSDRVAIEKPQLPDLPGEPYSWIILDELIYGNQAPWPTNANGGGSSLHRLSFNISGNDPANWSHGLPSPGIASNAPLDRDGDGMPDSFEVLHGLNPDDSSDASADSDNDGLSNLAEFHSGTDPRDPLSALRFDSVEVVDDTTVLTFTAMTNQSYTIQFTPDISLGLWQKLADVETGPQRQVSVPDPDSAAYTRRFYRLVTPSL